MNMQNFTIVQLENQTIISINLNQNENIIFHKKENHLLRIGDKICTIENLKEKKSIFSPIIGKIEKITINDLNSVIIVLKTCLHEIEFFGMCSECGIDIKYKFDIIGNQLVYLKFLKMKPLTRNTLSQTLR